MRHLLNTAAVCLLVGTGGMLAQSSTQETTPERQPDHVVTDPDAMIAVLSAWAEAGFLFKFAKEGKLDDALVNLRMKNRTRWNDRAGSPSGGEWVVETPRGFVSLRVWSPALFRERTDEAFIVFTPPSERPMPEAVLSHLLGKAERTKLDGARLLEIEMPPERAPSFAACRSQRTVKVLLDSGAMVLNGVRITCDLTPK